MLLEKKTVDKTDAWFISLNGTLFPLESIRAFCYPVALAALLAIAYSMGEHNAQEYVKFFAYFHGVEVQKDGITYLIKCNPAVEGNRVVFSCTNTTALPPGMNIIGLDPRGLLRADKNATLNLSQTSPDAWRAKLIQGLESGRGAGAGLVDGEAQEYLAQLRAAQALNSS